MDVLELVKLIPASEARMIKRSKELKQVVKDMAEKIERIPALRETDGDNAVCQLHYFDTCGSADWYIFEADLETGEGFGFVTFSGDISDPDAEFGYIDLFDLAKSARINLDLHYHNGITKNQIMLEKHGVEILEGAENEQRK